MEIKKFKFLLCIPIACLFVGVLHGQPWNPCASLGAQLDQCVIDYNECQDNCSYCANGWLTGVTDCASICNSPSCSPNACDQLREQYHNCNAGNNTGSTNTGATNTGGNNTGGNNTGAVDGGTCDNPPSNGECQDGYVIEGGCCVMECTVPTEKRNCIRDGWDWDDSTCKCKCNPDKGCCGVQLNVPMPFIGDCIELTTSNDINGTGGKLTVNQLNAFPVLIKGISKILVTLIMIFSIIVVIFAGVMMTTSVANEGNYKTGMNMLEKVIVALILLGTSGLILKLINPSFFGG